VIIKLARRKFLQLAAGAAALSALPSIASAQAYPTRPIHLIVGTAPGGPQDILARLMGQYLSERLGQPIIVENRPGAGTNIGTEAVVKAPADGYTLLLVNAASAINATLYAKLNFNFIRDIAPVAGIDREPLAMQLNPLVPAKSIPEFIAYAKTAPGKINFASGGIGAPSHIAGELFKMMAGVNLLHVPYRGAAPALTDLLGGQVQVYFGPIPSSIEYIKTGKLRALAVTTATRSDALPDVPTMGEFLPGYEASTWNGLGAPRNTPVEIIEKLNREIDAGLADPTIKARIAALGGTVFSSTPAGFGKFIADETEKWSKVIKFAGINLL
jgi:tripartite-type tricarboxylate transporter receptor subunit TctC